MKNDYALFALALFALFVSASVLAAEAPGDPYPLGTCPVMGKDLPEKDAPAKVIDGQELRFCCPDCIGKFEKDKKALKEKTDAQIAESQRAVYPLDTCIVTGEKLGGMGEVVELVYNNRLFRLCCQGCVDKITKDPAAYWKKLDDAVKAKQGPSYPLKDCLVSGKKLGDMGAVVEAVINNRLYKFCCQGCVDTVKKSPAAWNKKLDEARAKKQ